ncbi:hypothetical protein [Nocardia cyriacigeorgica]|nr:hypothetical protein [Nocardia cyriacigeorgica]
MIAPIACTLLASTPAAALSVTPSPSTVTVDLTQAEAQAITALNLGPLLGKLPPNFTPEAKQRLGESISQFAARAARQPGSTLLVIIDQPISSPVGVSVTIRS